MQNSVNTIEGVPPHPLDGLQLSLLRQAVAGLSGQQLAWASGYLAGLGAGEPAPLHEANESLALTILYATQGGNARSVADALAENAAGRGLVSRLVSADQYRPRDLRKERLLVVVISTQGEGEPPESALELFNYLRGNKPPRLNGLQYAVFGLGDSSYEQFCQAARDLDGLLKASGARCLSERVDADIDFQPQAAIWREKIVQSVEKLQPTELARIIPIQRAAATRHDRNHPYQAELLERRRVTTTDAVAEVHHLVLEVDPASIRYRPGDSLGLFFHNDPVLIEETLSLLGLAGDSRIALGEDEWRLADALAQRLELTQLHPNLVKAWASLAGDDALTAISQDGERLRNFVRDGQVIDLLAAYPAEVEAQELVNLLHPQQPRLYSIASSQKASEEEIHLTVSTLRYRNQGRDHMGGASGYLTQRIAEGDHLGIYVVENPSFKLPQQGDTPIIMVGAGTGIAPYRAFLQEREAQSDSGENWLVFGNRHFHRDFLYQTDWLGYRRAGLLNRISLAFSRDEGDRAYVQERLCDERSELFNWLQEGACLYVCGGVEMELGVRQSLMEIAQDRGGLSQEAALDYIDTLRQQGRYQRDVY
jgi:sulfite reductase (NADPH) flavoprotein alpha-component